jgi:hypothetical protein
VAPAAATEAAGPVSVQDLTGDVTRSVRRRALDGLADLGFRRILVDEDAALIDAIILAEETGLEDRAIIALEGRCLDRKPVDP